MKVIINSNVLKDVVNVLSGIVDEVGITAGDSGWSVCTADPAHVSLVSMNIPKESFVFYEFDEYLKEFTLDLDELRTGLGMMDGDDVAVTIENGKCTMKTDTVKYSHNTIHNAVTQPKVPSLQLPLVVDIPTNRLQKATRFSTKVSDHLRITFARQQDGLSILSGNDTSDVDVNIPASECEFIGLPGEPVSSMFPLDYLMNIVKPIPASCDKITLRLGHNYPCELRYSFGGIDTSFLLAPRIEND